MDLTILTPCYNRAYSISKLYDSLCRQSSGSFEWLVVDDGSTDITKELITKYKEEAKIKIEYVYQRNGGKHRALNNGIKRIKSKLTIIVDSDDWLAEDAVETILEYGEKYSNNNSIACISFHKMFSNGMISGPNYKKKEFIDNLISYRINKHVVGEGAEVFYTEKLKEFPFLEIPGERFLSEGYSWLRMALKYDTVYVDKAIYIFDYLPDGLTKNIKKLRRNNPKGCVEVSKIYFNKKFALLPKIKAMLRYIVYGKFANYDYSKMYKETKCKLLFALMYPFGYIYFKKSFNQVKNKNGNIIDK